MRHHHATTTLPRRQTGVVLVIALIMMAVIAVSSAAALRSAMNQDMIGNSQRSRGLALQAAETALRYCEAAVTTPTPTGAQAAIPIFDAQTPRAFEAITNWEGNGKLSTAVPDSYVFDKGAASYRRPPECMIERITLSNRLSGPDTPPSAAYLITARGFSPDFSANGNLPVSGAVVWLQSTVQF